MTEPTVEEKLTNTLKALEAANLQIHMDTVQIAEMQQAGYARDVRIATLERGINEALVALDDSTSTICKSVYHELEGYLTPDYKQAVPKPVVIEFYEATQVRLARLQNVPKQPGAPTDEEVERRYREASVKLTGCLYAKYE